MDSMEKVRRLYKLEIHVSEVAHRDRHGVGCDVRDVSPGDPKRRVCRDSDDTRALRIDCDDRPGDRRTMTTIEQALAEHLAAIRARDLDRLAATVTRNHLTLVTSGGEVHHGHETFLAMHHDWFASDTWSLATRLLHVHAGADMATCLLDLEYRDHPADGAPLQQQSVLTLVFAREGEEWRLVHDQNTPSSTPHSDVA
jgi:uncharacterized protein (TIGR02246 family)